VTGIAPPAISVRGLCRSFGEQVVLDAIDFEVAEGTVFALLGPNGAGKTTTIHILSTLLPADAGEVLVMGHDVAREPEAVRALIGLTGQLSAVDALFTGEENLRLMADLRRLGATEGRTVVAALLERFDLVEAARKPVATWSAGMRRRLDLAMTLVGHPRVIFLDEPTTGLDPRSRRVMWEIVRGLVDEGTTIVLTTQYLEEADRLAGQVALLDRGRLVAQGTPAQLKRGVRGGHIRLEFHDLADLDRAARVLGQGSRDEDGMALQLPNDGGTGSLRATLARLDAESIEIAALSVNGADLDDVFLSLTTEGHERSAAA
jgi:ABC-2 type transport system ATP-binding protein